MTISETFNRPKLNAVLVEDLDLTGAIAEGSGEFLVDINATLTDDGSTTKTKTLVRQRLKYVVSGTKISFSGEFYAFPGTAADYSVGGTTPPLSAATPGNEVDLDAFFTQAGDARKNS